VAEPIRLSDALVVEAFSGCELNMVVNRSGREMFEALVKTIRFAPEPKIRRRAIRNVARSPEIIPISGNFWT
jgi:hypothetical protein